jgi:hypothetical protein
MSGPLIPRRLKDTNIRNVITFERRNRVY